MTASENTWNWLTDYRNTGYCLTFTYKKTLQHALESYGVNERELELLTFQESTSNRQHHFEGSTLRLGIIEDWVFCFESHGVLGAIPQVLEKLSSETETISLTLGGDGMNTMEIWVNSSTREHVELTPSLRARGSSHPSLQGAIGEEMGANPDQTYMRAALRILARRTGVTLTESIGQGTLLTAYRATPTHKPYVQSVHDSTAATENLGRRLGSLYPNK